MRRGARGGVAVLNGLVLLTTVQRPLATVVIGGLVTSTLLTLFVVPTLYAWLGRRWFARPNGPATPAATEN